MAARTDGEQQDARDETRDAAHQRRSARVKRAPIGFVLRPCAFGSGFASCSSTISVIERPSDDGLAGLQCQAEG